jgi:ankyrin repeat protein
MSRTKLYKAIKDRDFIGVYNISKAYDLEHIDYETNSLIWYINYNNYKEEDSKILNLLFMNGVDLNAKNKHGQTLLHAAVELNNCKLVEELLNYNVNVNEVDNTGQSALHYAIYNCDLYLTVLLLNNSVNPNIQDNDGWTPLMNLTAQLFNQHINIENLLQLEDFLIEESNIKLKTKEGQNAKDIAKVFNNKRMYKKLTN